MDTLFASSDSQSSGVLNYNIQGFFTYQVFSEKRSFPLHRRTFKLDYSNGQWKVTVGMLDKTSINSFLYFWDRTNLVYTFEVPPQEKARPSAVIEDVPVPKHFSGDGGDIIWLALASQSYFGELTNNSAYSFEELSTKSFLRKRFLVPCRYTLSSQPPFLPEEVSYMTTNLPYLLDTGIAAGIPLPEPFQDGYERGKFSASGFTNINGLSFPAVFEYDEYTPLKNAKSRKDLLLALQIHGVATNFNVHNLALTASKTTKDGAIIETSETENPLAGKRVYVQDMRLPEPGVLYPVTNADIPGVMDPRLKWPRTRALQKLRAMSGKRPYVYHNAFFVCLISIIFVSPLIVIRLKRKIKTN